MEFIYKNVVSLSTKYNNRLVLSISRSIKYKLKIPNKFENSALFAPCPKANERQIVPLDTPEIRPLLFVVLADFNLARGA